MKKKSNILYWSVFGNWLAFSLITLTVFFVYSKCSVLWVNFGGIDFDDWHLFVFEPLFFLFLSILFFFSKIQNRLSRWFLPIIPVLIFYSSFDVFYSFLKRSPHPSDLHNILTIKDFSPWLGLAFLIWVFLIPMTSALFLICQVVKKYSSEEIIISFFLKTAALFVVSVMIFSGAVNKLYIKTFNYIDWSQERTIKSNGRISSFIYYGMQERKNRDRLKTFSKEILSKTINIHNELYPDDGQVDKRNIHFIVLESFLDPRLIEDATFNISPLSDELIPFMLEGGNFSLVTSPVYGGRTAEAEFELLTGIQALSTVDSIEFNVMMGSPASSFVKKLTDSDYQAVATIASSSGYFNSKQAYRSLGFKNITFLKELDKFRDPEWMPVFDGDLFRYNLNIIAELVKNKKQPLVSYTLGMYGHFPYETDPQNQPDVIEVKHEDDRVQKIANQFFYRTKAIAEYITQLLLIDQNSIIYVTSDHLPPILWDGTRYKFEQHTNISLLLDAGKPVDVSGKGYFQIPRLIWGILSGKENNQQIDETMMENLYFKLLSESICNEYQ